MTDLALSLTQTAMRPPVGAAGDTLIGLLLESGSPLLLEDGGQLIPE